MQKFKISVTKNQKKYALVFDAINESVARDKAHAAGYSILSVAKFSSDEITGKQFYFEAKSGDDIKKWKIVWKDIFKIYVKLRQQLWYQVVYLYSESDKDSSEIVKNKIIRDLEHSYTLYIGTEEKKEELPEQKDDFEGFYLKKELEETYKLIDFVLQKLQNIMQEYQFYGLDTTGLENTQQVYNSIIKIKKTTNIAKLKEIWERALLKIGSIELRSIEYDKNIEQRDLLKQTNQLLKKIGSNQKFIEEDRDIKKIFIQLFEQFKSFTQSFKAGLSAPKKQLLDKDSYSYMKTKLLRNKYHTRLQQNTSQIIQHLYMFMFPFWKNKNIVDDITMKRRVIRQNISLLDAKLSGKVYSYVAVIKGYKKTIQLLLSLCHYLSTSLFYIIFIYSMLFVFFISISQVVTINIHFNFHWFLYFILLLFSYFVVLLSRGLFTLMLNFVFLFFIIIFAIVNF